MEARRTARKAVRNNKNRWLRHLKHLLIGMVEKCIMDIQRSSKGLVPVQVTVVKDEDSRQCTIPESQQQ